MAMYSGLPCIPSSKEREEGVGGGGGAFSRGALVFYYGLRGKALIWGSFLTGVNTVYHHHSVD